MLTGAGLKVNLKKKSLLGIVYLIFFLKGKEQRGKGRKEEWMGQEGRAKEGKGEKKAREGKGTMKKK